MSSSESVQKGSGERTFIIKFVMPDPDPASPANFNDRIRWLAESAG